MAPTNTPSDTWRLVVVVALWAGVFEILSLYGFDVFPRALLHELTLEAYLTMVDFVVLGAGLGAAFALLRRPEATLPLRVSTAKPVFSTVALAPFVFSLCTTVAFLVARPTLVAEILAGGREQAQASTGRFGRELVESPALLAFVWGAVVSPVGEELFFRGALWSLVQRGVDRVRRSGPPSTSDGLPPELIERSAAASGLERALGWFARGGMTTIVVALCFGFLHWDMPGGLGIVRFVSALGLGVACGVARQATGSVAAPIALHALFNALSLATVRRWVVTEAFPMSNGAPTLVSIVGVLGLVVVVATSIRSARSGRAA